MKSRYARIVVLLAVLGMAVLIAVIWFVSGSSGVEAYKAQLRARGEKLTFQELSPTNAGHSFDFSAVGPELMRLGWPSVPPSNIELMRIMKPGYAQPVCELKAVPVGDGRTADWTDFHQQMRERDASLERIRLVFLNPSTNRSAVRQTITLVDKRKSVQWLSAAFLHELHEGRRDRALDFLLAPIVVAGQENSHDMLVEQMIRVAVAGLAIHCSWEFLQGTNVTHEELRRLEAKWRQLDLISGFERCLVNERAMGLDYFEKQRQPDSAASLFWRSALANADELFYLETLQLMLETVRGGVTNLSWKRMKTQLEERFTKGSKWQQRIESLRFPVSALVGPNLAKALERTMKTRTEIALLLAHIDLKQYEMQHGRQPSEKEAKQLLTHVIDPMDGKPIRYKASPAEGWFIYSAGTNGTDDGGSAAPLVGSKGSSDIWRGQDAIWPRAEF